MKGFSLKQFIGLFCLVLVLAACSPWGNATTNLPDLRVQKVPTARVTYVAIGASDTYGTGADDPQTQNWAADLADKLGSNVRTINLGIPGITVQDALHVELPIALDAHPTLVTIWLAVNDLVGQVAPADYARDLESLVSQCKTHLPKARVLVANVPNLLLLPRFQTSTGQAAEDMRSTIAAYNSSISTIVQRYSVELVDLYSLWQALADHSEYISSDGFHPSTAGYKQLAEIFYQKVQARQQS